VLAAHGMGGVARRIEHQVAVADRLRAALRASGFTIVNHTPLPLVCFTHPRLVDTAAHDAVARRLRLGQTAWLSRVILDGRTPALRACVTSYETRPEDVDALLRALLDTLP
jgi:glutamate/tyrosine decarboxylase-like PLP-dependent enzyme